MDNRWFEACCAHAESRLLFPPSETADGERRHKLETRLVQVIRIQTTQDHSSLAPGIIGVKSLDVILEHEVLVIILHGAALALETIFYYSSKQMQLTL
eukprot:6208531-Pleurochrysis_carterae.AAC.9